MRRGFTLLEIMIVVLVLGILAAIAVPGWRQVRETTQIRTCAANRERIERGKQEWYMEGRDSTDVPTMADLVPTHVKEVPQCPAGGTYTLGDSSTKCACSVHGQ